MGWQRDVHPQKCCDLNKLVECHSVVLWCIIVLSTITRLWYIIQGPRHARLWLSLCYATHQKIYPYLNAHLLFPERKINSTQTYLSGYKAYFDIVTCKWTCFNVNCWTIVSLRLRWQWPRKNFLQLNLKTNLNGIKTYVSLLLNIRWFWDLIYMRLLRTYVVSITHWIVDYVETITFMYTLTYSARRCRCTE